jgi:TM2 domain-containing membrane protein YozV
MQSMNRNSSLIVASLLTILFTTFHGAHDMILGYAPAGFFNLPVIVVLFLWLYATLAIGERRLPYVVVMIMSLLASAVPIIHMTGQKGLVGRSAPGSAGAFFFAWTLVAVGITAMLSVVLSVRGLWTLRRRTSRPA